MIYKVLIISVLSCFVQFSQSKEFPKEITRCRLSDNACLVKVTNDIIRNHPHGYPDINLINLEPFRIDDIIINGDPSKPINFNLEMTNLSFTGYSNTTFTKIGGLTPDPKNIKLSTEGICEHSELRGKYKISGKMLIFPITGEGDLTCIFDGLHIKTHSKPKVEVRDGKEYIKMDNIKIKAKADHMTVKMTNLFNGDKTLGESMNKILNENWKVLWEEIEPSFTDQFTKVNGDTIDKVINSFPYKDMYISEE